MKVAVIESLSPRFNLMKERLKKEGIDFDVFNFNSPAWLDVDFSVYTAIYLYPKFLNDSGNPDCLLDIKDNLQYLSEKFPSLNIYPDPKLNYHFL